MSKYVDLPDGSKVVAVVSVGVDGNPAASGGSGGGGAITRTQMAAATIAIASGQTVSAAFDSRGYAMFGLVLPAAFTGAALTFQVSADNIAFQPLYDTANTPVALAAVVQGRGYDVPPELSAWPYWKVVSGAAEAAARNLVIVAKG